MKSEDLVDLKEENKPASSKLLFCLQCNTCHGEYNCVGENVTCTDPSASCMTSVRKAYVSFLEFQSVKKGCARQLYPPESISINSHLLSLSYQARYCAEDGCNNETYFVSHPAPANHMRCHTCASQGAWCPETSRTQITCVGDQDQCVDMDITGKLGQYSNLKLKGCTNLQRCEDTLSFYSGSRTIHTSCCNTPLCNSFNPDLHILSQAPNGLECYSCVEDDGSMSGCSSQAMSKVQCMGIHTMCLEGIGKSRTGGKDLGLVTFKGCASPAMCQSTLLSLVQELDNTELLCCQGNLCNNRIIDGVVKEARVPYDSADVMEVPECVKPTPAQPSVASRPECIDTEEKEEDKMLVAPPAGVTASPGAHVHTDTTHTTHDMEATENSVTEGAATTTSPHHEVHSGERIINENVSGGSSEGNAVSPTGSTGAENLEAGGSSATTNLEKSGTTSSGNHGNIVVLVPVIVSKRNKTAVTTTTTTSSETGANHKVLEASNHKVLEASNNKISEASSNTNAFEEEECEAEEEDDATRGQFLAVGERNLEGGAGAAAEGHSNANAFLIGRSQGESASATERDHRTGVFSAGPHRPSHSPAMASHPQIPGEESFVADPSASQPGHGPRELSVDAVSFAPEGSTSPSGAGVISEVGTARLKNKVLCKRPGSQRRPGGKLGSSSGAEKQVQEKGTPRDATNTLFSETKNPGKVNLGSGAFGLSGNFHLFSLCLVLVALLH
ncbi:hypothetical protein JRQ81_011623 [Phrynocephalus forsythii]|uniref:UPAR/Ly6 domain-containing protein n=1 Tax=Phrynocephalus forsythii TaxID=171643 RepID=A0A9Q0X6J3_9SAUR|nr:hypothetical protein JRQ81_011623 [Phrynocephalus forsythii]